MISLASAPVLMTLRDLFKIDLDAPNQTNRELWLKLVALILRVVAVLSIVFAVVKIMGRPVR